MRPLVHFTPARNFMNDPNGLVYHAGEYHLFYQHNPFGEVWGHMSWGHAVSRDLVRWEHLPVALAEEDGVMMFSGCAVVDHENTSGFGTSGNPPLVAIYTGHSEREQTQNIAYSRDLGRTWIKYPGNPVIAIGSREYRDPKVIWHAPTRRWVMVTVLADLHKVRFDASPDLIHWEHLSDYGPFGADDGFWECPDLFPLPVEGEPGEVAWVVKVDVCRTVGAQIIVGDFDGRVFTPRDPGQVWRVDYGADFYAAQSWSDTPDGRRIWLAWMSNWHYANQTPSSPWRGQCTLPRELILRRTAAGLRPFQRPIAELERARGGQVQLHMADVDDANAALAGLEALPACEIALTVALGSTRRFSIKVDHGGGQETVLTCDVEAGTLALDRTRSGDSSFSDVFAAVHTAPLVLEHGALDLRIFLDACSIEVFAQHGGVVHTDLIFPRGAEHALSFVAEGGEPTIQTLAVWPLGPA